MAFTLQPAVKDDFIDREDILADMLTTLEDESTRIGFALVGPRRIGKTSILKEVVRRLEGEKGHLSIYGSSIQSMAEKKIRTDRFVGYKFVGRK